MTPSTPGPATTQPTNTVEGADYIVTIARDGNQWCALLGENLQEGYAGFASTPGEALRALAADWERPAEASSRQSNEVSKLVDDLTRQIARSERDEEGEHDASRGPQPEFVDGILLTRAEARLCLAALASPVDAAAINVEELAFQCWWRFANHSGVGAEEGYRKRWPEQLNRETWWLRNVREALQAAASPSVDAGGAREADDTKMRAVLERLMLRAWALTQWNDHNFTYAQHSEWKRKVEESCKEAEALLAASRPEEPTDGQ